MVIGIIKKNFLWVFWVMYFYLILFELRRSLFFCMHVILDKSFLCHVVLECLDAIGVSPNWHLCSCVSIFERDHWLKFYINSKVSFPYESVCCDLGHLVKWYLKFVFHHVESWAVWCAVCGLWRVACGLWRVVCSECGWCVRWSFNIGLGILNVFKFF